MIFGFAKWLDASIISTTHFITAIHKKRKNSEGGMAYEKNRGTADSGSSIGT